MKPLEFRARLDGDTLQRVRRAMLALGATDARFRTRSPTGREFLRLAARLVDRRATLAAIEQGLDLHAEIARRASPTQAKWLSGSGSPEGCAPAPDYSSDGPAADSLLTRLRDSGLQGVNIR